MRHVTRYDINIIKRLPLPLARHVYSYDDTYKQKFESTFYVLNNLNIDAYYYEFTRHPVLCRELFWGNFSPQRIRMLLENRDEVLKMK